MTTVNSETAEAVAVYFLQLFPYAFATGDLTDWNEFSHSECVYCASVRSDVEENIAQGRHDVGGLVTVTDATATQVSDRWWHVVLHYTEDPSVSLDANGNVVEEFPGNPSVQADIAVILEDERFLIREVDYTVL